jgi:hypothetical protein
MVPIVHRHVLKGSYGGLNGDLVQLMGTAFEPCFRRFLSEQWAPLFGMFQAQFLNGYKAMFWAKAAHIEWFTSTFNPGHRKAQLERVRAFKFVFFRAKFVHRHQSKVPISYQYSCTP